VDWAQVGERLRCIRKESGLSQREFGQHFGVSQNMISLYEKGKSHASVEFCVRVARLGDKTIEWLLTGQPDSTLETLREMHDLHEKMKNHLAIVRQLLDRETAHAMERTVASIEDPERLREALLAEKGLSTCVKEALQDPDEWRTLGMTGREVCGLLGLERLFGELTREGLQMFLQVVRRATRFVEPEKSFGGKIQRAGQIEAAPASPSDPT
jgi:transcriptional regulator with XRE-family HTH domain